MAMIWFLLAFLLWAVVHSLTAARAFKEGVRRRVGERAYAGFYRLFYNLLAFLTFLPILYLLARAVPATVLWRLPRPWALLFLLIQGAGLVGLLVSLWQTDLWHFVGVRQALRYLQGAPDPAPPVPFVRTGTYALVRHPLYFFSMIVIWFTPLMTLNTLLFNLLATIYFYLGALHEERRLAATFGETYRRYQQEVPAFLPLPWGMFGK